MRSTQRNRNVHDPVWGDIGLTEEEWQLIGLPVFQRLRRIHQLGLTMLVFPGATHTRFEHSLGVCHAAGAIGDRLVSPAKNTPKALFGPDDVRIVRLAGLLHDIGHGVFSHVSDPLFARNDDKRDHEWIGAQVIETDPAIRRIIGSSSAEAIAGLLRAEGSRSVVRDIVSGAADADKLDYLLRDTYYTGVRHHFDHHHFIDQVTAISDGRESWLGFDWGGLWSVEGMILARHHLHRAVYGHRNRLVTDYMLRRGLERGMGRGPLPEDLLTIPRDSQAFPAWRHQYETYDDWRVMSEGPRSDDPVACEMFRRLREHDLLKLLVYIEDLDLDHELGELAVRSIETHSVDVDIAGLEAAVAADIPCDPNMVIARILDSKNPLERPRPDDPGNDAIYLRTFDGDGMDPFTRRSEIFSASPSAFPRRKLLIYAPMAMRDPATRLPTDLSRRVEKVALGFLRQTLGGPN